MPNEPVLLTILDDVESVLNGMGKEAGYHRDYGRVHRVVWGWDQEPDINKPSVLMTTTTLPPELATGYQSRNNAFAYVEEVQIVVHLSAEFRDDGTWDAITPYAEVRADIHKAMISSDEDRKRGIACWTTTHYSGSEPRFFSEGKDAIGATVVERYLVTWRHADGDMATAV